MSHPVQPETLDLRSHHIAEDKKQELLRLFPEIRTEDGKIDFERLKLALGDMVDGGKERYGMNWPGKADCFKTIQAPSLGTLRPCREESVNGRIYFGKDGSSQPGVIRYFSEVEGLVPWTWWPSNEVGHTDEARKEIREIFGSQTVYETPKPTRLIQRILEIASSRDGLVVDFFAGSGTTAQAIIELNKQDGGNRKFILVQLPEPTGRDDYPTIADITKERVRRVIQRLNQEGEGRLLLNGSQKPDLGFKVFKLAESNFKTWNANVPAGDTATLLQQLELHIDHIRDSRTAEDILYEILLKSGFPLTTPVEQLTLAGKTVYSVAGGALFICLERQLTLDLVRAMAEHRPERVVCLDNGFAGNDQLKANAVQIFKNKGVTSFKTV
jgi:adenine-specific DNA-methyltransferase